MKDPTRFKLHGQSWQPQPVPGSVAGPRKSKSGYTTKRSQPSLEEFLKQIDPDKILNLSAVSAGDSLQITTRNTTYTFRMLDTREAVLSTNRLDRPTGPARLRGCTIGRSSAISPDLVFCGGNLEFLFNSTKKIHRTTEITAILWLSRGQVG